MIKNTIPILIVLLLVSIFANASNASEYLDTDQGNEILLKNAVFDPLKQPPVSVKTGFATSQYSTDTEEYYILQFKGNVLEEWKQAVKNTGAVFFDYVPNNAFIVRMNLSVKSQVEAMDVVQWVGTYQPAYKISPVFSSSSIAATTTTTTISDDDVSDIIVMLFDSKHNAQITSEIKQLNGEIVDNAGEIMRVRIGTSKLSDIAAMTGVSWIEKYVQPVVFNDIAANITNVSYVRNTHGLTGSGQIVAVADTGLDTGVDDHGVDGDIHLDFDNKVTFFNYYGSSPDDNNGHGTHVTGSVAGDGSRSNGSYKGMAPNAEIIFQGIGDDEGTNYVHITNLTKIFFDAYNSGAQIHSNSWGGYGNGSYTSLSQETDQFAWDNKNFVIVFAAGNAGPNGNTIDSPGTSKNIITVGASQSSRFGDTNTIANFSSRGPTDDGRIKPDVVAPGTSIISTRSSMSSANYSWGVVDNYYAYSSGTSMATPITAGSAALVRQYYVDNELISPSAALIKATLINGAANMSCSTDEQGWGRVDIEKSLFPTLPRTMHYYDSISLITSQSWNVSYSVSSCSEPLRITIVWTDYPSATFVGKTLVNDLDLNVTGPDGIYLGNDGDNTNNVEQVEITSPAIGLYTITINGTNVPHGPQPFAIVASGALSSDVNSPTVNNEFPTNNSYTNNSATSVSINITDTGSGVNLSSIEMSINDNPVGFTNVSIPNGYKIENVTSTPYGEELFTVSINASDNASNSLTFNWSFTIDTTPPVITSATANPQEIEANGTDNTLLNVTATDLHGIASVTVNLSAIGGLPAQAMSNNSGVWQFTINTTTVGLFELSVNVTDNAGNSNTSANITLNVVDTTPPVVIDTSPENLATDVKIDSSITATFGEPMNSSTLNDTIVKVYKLATGKITGETFENVNGTWNSSNFQIFSHADELKIEQTPVNDTHRTILENNLTYSTRPMPRYYQLYIGKGIEEEGSNYSVIGWLGDEYIAVNGKPEKLTNLVFEQKTADTKTLQNGEIWDLGDGYSLKVIQIESDGNNAWIGLYNSSGSIANKVIENQSSCWVIDDIANENDVPFFVTYLNKVTNTAIELKYTWLISQDATVIEKGNLFGVFKVETISNDTIRLTNDENVSLTKGSTIALAGNLKFEVEDNSTVLYRLVGTGKIKTALGGDISYNSASRTVTFDPVSNLVYSTTYISYITTGVEDLVGNGLLEDYEWEFKTISSPPSQPPSNNGGGGGGGGGTSGEPYENIEFKDAARAYVSRDAQNSFIFDKPENVILYVRYKALTSAGYISTVIEVLKDTSTFAKQAAPEIIYKNINIWVGKSGYATEKNIEDPVIGFKVAKSWIKDDSIDVRSIKLNRYHDDTWTALPTAKTDEDDTHVYFESSTPGFSPFAITGQKKMLISPVSVKTEAEPAASAPVEEPSVAAAVATETEAVPQQPSGWKYLLTGAVVLLIIAGAYMYMRKRQS